MERHNGIEPDPEGAFTYYADAQATIAALQARAEQAERLVASQAQEIIQRRQTLGDLAHLHQEQSKQLTQRTAELEAAKRLATNAQWQIDYVLDEAKKAFDLKGHYTPSDLVDCVLRPATSMLKERDGLKAELERVRGKLAETKLYLQQERANRDSLAACVDRDVQTIKELRALIAALPKVEGEITANRVCTIMMRGLCCEEFTKLLQCRQGME